MSTEARAKMKTKARKADVPEHKKLLTAQQVAELLGVSLRKVWSIRASGRLKAVKFGKKTTRFRPEDVAKLIERGA